MYVTNPQVADVDLAEQLSSRPVIMLMGPTGAGKTDLAVELVRHLPVDIISVDSVMVYRALDIGTGKPDKRALEQAPHRLIDVREPEQAYSAAEFRADALREIADIHNRARVPLLVGGTGLYFRALTRGLSLLPAADPSTRARLAERARAVGWGSLHADLATIDPTAAKRIHPNDPQRIQRALEVYELTGSTLTELQGADLPLSMPFPSVSLVIAPPDRDQLHAKIERRFDGMLAAGLVDEVARLRGCANLHRELPSMRAVGYRQIWEYLEDEVSFASMRERSLAATRQLARRQLTWLRAESVAVWLDPGGDPLEKALTLITNSIEIHMGD